MRIWLRISETLPCTSDSGAENTTTLLTTPSSRIGSATCPSSTSPRYSVPRASRPVRAATSATWKRRSSICTSIVESENGAPSCRPSVPPPTVNSVTRVLVASSMRATRPLIWRAVPLSSTSTRICGVKSRAVRAIERSFCSVSEDSSCGVT